MDTFSFVLERPYQEIPVWPAEETAGSQSGIPATRAITSRELITIPTAQAHVTSYSVYAAFWRAQKGMVKKFKFKAYYVDNFLVILQQVGTGNGSQVDFYLTHLYIDAATFKVYLNDVLQSSGFTLNNNEVKPFVRFTVAPGGGITVKVSYEYYLAVKFTDIAAPNDQLVPGKDYTNEGIVLQTVGMREWKAGGRYAPP